MRTTITPLLNERGFGSRLFVGIIVIALVFDVILLSRLSKAQKDYHLHADQGEGEDNKRYVSYYKKKQIIQTLRGAMRFVIIMFFVIRHNPNIFAGMAIALGAFVLTFGSFAVSFVVYLYLMTTYSPGDSVKIGKYMGEIITITPLYTKILGKNITGEHTGELINIPNHQIWQDNIILVDLSLSGIQKVLLTIPYDHKLYDIAFDEFLLQLQGFLDEYLQTNTTKMAEHYKSYKGHKYKMAYDLTEDGVVLVKLGFLTKRIDAQKKRLAVISFVESFKSHKK